MKTFAAVMAFCVLTGCSTNTKQVTPPAAVAVVQPVDDAAVRLQAAIEAQAKVQADRDSKLAASAEVIVRQNDAAPESPQKPVIKAEGILLQRTLAVVPSPEDRAAAAERESLMLAGRLSEASKLYAQTSAKADALNRQLARLTIERDAANKQLADAVDKAQADLTAQNAKHDRDMAALNAEHARQISELKNSIAQRVRFWTTLTLYGLATACLLLAALRIKAAMATGLNVLAAAKTAATWTGLSGTLFLLSRIIAAPWFWWACGGVVAAIIGYIAFLVWNEQRAAAAKRALTAVVTTVDKIYDDKIGAAKDDMDAAVFQPLSDAMKDIPGAKAAVHEVRAAVSTTTPVTK